MPRQTKEEKKIDGLIEAAYYRHGNNVQVNVMDIPNIFNAGRAALQAGKDLDTAMIELVAKYRQN